MWCCCCVVTAQVCGVFVLSVKLLQIRDDVRRARDAESAHMEAALKIDGAKYLRLARLRDILRERGFGNADCFELKNTLGEAPQLWLDLRHCVTIEPDAGTYRLTVHGVDHIEVVLETISLDEAVATSVKVLAHSKVRASRDMSSKDVQSAVSSSSNHATLAYVWLTGVITGMAALSLYAILLKKMPF